MKLVANDQEINHASRSFGRLRPNPIGIANVCDKPKINAY